MKIAFFTEMGFNGRVARTHSNMRTEFAWMVALDADHYNYRQIPIKQYDLGIVIIPKKNPQFNLDSIKQVCSKVAVMQEGPHWYFQDYPLDKQIWYFNTLVEADIIYTHNESDKQYFAALTEHRDVRVLPSLMIEDAIGTLEHIQRKGILIGGNFVYWYGGFDSFVVAREVADKVWAPSMGRKQEGEASLVEHLPYLDWREWIHKLNEFKIGVHLMRTHAAGTFALNCAYLGIPCIGYRGLDTQQICHPSLTVEVGDLEHAKRLIRALDTDPEFYNFTSKEAEINYKLHYNENKFYTNFLEQFVEI